MKLINSNLVEDIRSYFPIFSQYPDLAYLDNAATTQRPDSVIQAINQFNSFENSNIHRGVYDLSNKATEQYENTRQKVADYLGSNDPLSVAFTSGTTESINILARSFLKQRLDKSDNIVITILEHHSNFVPWQILAEECEAELRVVPLDDDGDIDLKALTRMLDHKTKILSLNHISNTLGTINNIGHIIEIAHKVGIPVMIDAAQSAAWYDIDVAKLDYDFIAFSGHKMFGPFGVGILYVAEKWRDQILPYNYGGGIIKEVSIHGTTFREFPFNLDAGTPAVSSVIGLSAAIDFISRFEKTQMQKHLAELTAYCSDQLSSISKVKLLSKPKKRGGIISFNVEGIHPHDVASFLNKDDIAVRAGMHCTQPLLASLNLTATVRVSFSAYNKFEEIDRLKQSILSLIKFWS